MTKGFKLKGNPMFSKGERKLCCLGKYHKVRLFCYHTLGQIQDFMWWPSDQLAQVSDVTDTVGFITAW